MVNWAAVQMKSLPDDEIVQSDALGLKFQLNGSPHFSEKEQGRGFILPFGHHT